MDSVLPSSLKKVAARPDDAKAVTHHPPFGHPLLRRGLLAFAKFPIKKESGVFPDSFLLFYFFFLFRCHAGDDQLLFVFSHVEEAVYVGGGSFVHTGHFRQFFFCGFFHFVQ